MNKYHGHTRNAQDSRPAWQPKPYTEKQAAFIMKMMGERGITAEKLREVFPSRPSSAADASKVIEWLLAQPKADVECQSCGEPRGQLAHACGLQRKPSTPQTSKYQAIAPLGEEGKPHSMHYAIEVDGEVKFYRVKRGRKAGIWFVDVQASDDYHPIRNSASRKAILDAIAVDPKAALARYGQLIGSCGRCGRTLTSEYRELGIGPVCIDK